ncbi:hypothetical protein HaLaN_33187, partial [Haematococcus lacustris]
MVPVAQRLAHWQPRNLTISASHWSLWSRTATCAREHITAPKRVSLPRYSLPPNTPFGSAHTKVSPAYTPPSSTVSFTVLHPLHLQ